MQANKTPHRNAFLNALAQVNDQVCFVLFLDFQIGPELQDLADKQAAEYTPTVFPENPFAERIYVSMGKLLTFRSAQVQTALGVSFAFAVEQLLLYIETSIRHWSEINGVVCQFTEPIDACLQSWALKNANGKIDANLIKTVKYLRLRRNHVIHNASELTSELTKTLKYDGPSLQKSWEFRTTIPGLDFSSGATRVFSADETISLIKLVRICVEEIDAFLAKELDGASVLKWLDKDLLTRQPELRAEGAAIITRRVRKVKKRVLEMYALVATPTEVAHVLGVAI
ncbi:MAG: hypothetical protein Q8M93_01585 [Polaromonas sp.]|uniref:hypothetical protein n=1 Tax=Polaromonas sp. TaxID=1869339 RepID=UPI002730F9F0|nr:hypothetical protein [Polaromonas sp.]MDP2450134.1 hypothetical protein [Polaromonas sp.]MDP3245639.1 hypothetical protein [Polaromonas sp.]MDP3757638.1 hypothetical protein [Polaromonas sp.]